MKLKIGMFLLLCLILSAPTALAQEGGINAARLARMAKGVNLTNWFWFGPEDLADVAEVYTDEDFQLLRDLGLTFVRLPIDLGFLLDEDSPDLLKPEELAVLDGAIAKILTYDLAVMVEIHSTSLDDAARAVYSGRLEDDPSFVEVFARFWKSFAAHLSATDPEMVFLEAMNEPVFENRTQDWLPIQAKLLAAIREGAPQHTLVATGALWSNLDTLLTLEPLDDPNIVYNFHFYEPFLFTHQGATWSWYAVVPLRDIPYPSDPEVIQPALNLISDSEIQGYIRDYGEQRWNADRLDERIASTAAWGKKHGVPVICNEFGSYSIFAPDDSRARWIHDVRTIFEKYDIGWAMWEYQGGFGLALPARVGPPMIDVPVAEALGLTP